MPTVFELPTIEFEYEARTRFLESSKMVISALKAEGEITAAIDITRQVETIAIGWGWPGKN